MAGSYSHCVTEDGKLRNPYDLAQMLENGGDVYEAVEELYGMVWYLADGDELKVEEARRMYRDGLQSSPGLEEEDS
jgi:hypothetical protein